MISFRQTLSESLIREFQDQVDWEMISEHQRLSEPFIQEFQDQVDWEMISHYQKLSIGFIREHKHRLIMTSDNIQSIIRNHHAIETLSLDYPEEICNLIGSWLI